MFQPVAVKAITLLRPSDACSFCGICKLQKQYEGQNTSPNFFEAVFFPIIAIFLTSRSAIFKRFLSRSNKYFEMGGNKDGLVERPFASYLFSLGLIPEPGVTCGLSFVVNSRPCSEGFFSGSNST